MMSLNFSTVSKAAALAGAGLLASAAASGAATIDIWNDSPSATTERASLECDFCSVLLYSFDGTDAGDVTGTNNVTATATGNFGFGTAYGELFSNSVGVNPTGEVGFINSLLGTTYALADHSKTDPASDGTEYTSSAAYVIVKIGKAPNYTILRNDSTSGAFSFTWTGGSGQGAGISHFSEIGAAAPVVPVPAAGVLLLGGLGAFAAMRRRKKA